MIVWGGTASGTYLNTGSRYDPATDTWQPTSAAGAPAGRTRHTAVWTGRAMIVWGGYYYLTGTYTYMNTGGRYDPAADSWAATSVGADVPTEREQHTAVWTGSTMIVWGGYDNTGMVLNTGGRYDPATDNWLTTSTIDAPTGRRAHTAVWTGGTMIVWGGIDITYAETNTGGRYYPATDNWLTTSTTGMPGGSSYHTAVWTGSRMIVWGGSGGNGNPGGRYDPATDNWLTTSMIGAPTGWYNHSAVWTGREMIVWGGWNGTTGGRYDPAADTWQPTPRTGAPTGRQGFTAVWTGREMIVWGGLGTGLTGGRYDPAAATSIEIAPVSAMALYCGVNPVTFTASLGTPPYTWGTSDDSGNLSVLPGGQQAEWKNIGDGNCTTTVTITVTDSAGGSAAATINVYPFD
jgi:N-acetylneuraminic acid mutarotase